MICQNKYAVFYWQNFEKWNDEKIRPTKQILKDWTEENKAWHK